jgi:HTH-type transcriptional regulator/antitoxin HipB
MMETVADIGLMIRQQRKRLGLTQKELAMTCGTGLRFIGELENGKPTCHIGKTLQVISALGLKITVNGIVEEPPHEAP